ncbi:hypothetical protein O0I10_013328 [Lichtheimia ornata]|uniref:Uncharacterized protein n=1 Tax=Lichtheimia ornata TaxID=688661 RepID=A0AAD7XNX5_9FUNG|nr:uncharacterized protein O0I10_013328 [Lichtheimia ornata]KAJ8651214.1 hypothetical protein O0I10_013328 [Lichtheimia ornata]
MFLVPLIHTQYSARTPITTYENTISIPSIRGGSPSPSASSSSPSSRPSNSSSTPSTPSTPIDRVTERKEKLARDLLALSRQVKAASFSSTSNTIDRFDDWLNQVEELKQSIITQSFPSSNARFRKQ